MEGLMIHAVVRELSPHLPLPVLGWSFPDEACAVLHTPVGSLVLRYRPPVPILTLQSLQQRSQGTVSHTTPFGRMLEHRCLGHIVRLEQHKLDRVVEIEFSGEEGFVSTPPCSLIFELTGRNANMMLLREGRIIGLDRPVTKDINRFRELRVGLPYSPPPPYQKLDPRGITLEGLKALLGRKAREAVQSGIDGFGKELTKGLLHNAQLGPNTTITEQHLPVLLQHIAETVRAPKLEHAQNTDLSAQLQHEWEQDQIQQLRQPLLEASQRQIKSLRARLDDAQQAQNRLSDASKLRTWGDLLMAFGHQLQGNVFEGLDFEGQTVRVPLVDQLNAIQSASNYYQRAKRLEAKAERAMELEIMLEGEVATAEAAQKQLLSLNLKALQQRSQNQREQGPVVGARATSPSGYSVWIGRNNKENDILTRAAHSEDLWFHVQGMPGSHIVLRVAGKTPPLEDLLFAAACAAYNSRAKGDRNIAVDYTLKKYVWKPRKAAAGGVLYSQNKTLFVDAILPTQ